MENQLDKNYKDLNKLQSENKDLRNAIFRARSIDQMFARAVGHLWRLLPPVTEHVRSDVLAQKIGAAAAGRRAVH